MPPLAATIAGNEPAFPLERRARLEKLMRETCGARGFSNITAQAVDWLFNPEHVVFGLAPEAFIGYKFEDLPDQKVDPTTGEPIEYSPNRDVWLDTPCRTEGLRRAKIVTAHFGKIPDWVRKDIIGKQELVAEHFLNHILPSIEKEILETRFGDKSFIRKFVRGTISTHEVEMTRWKLALDSKIFEFQNLPPNVLKAAKLIVEAKDERIKKLWDLTYLKAAKNAGRLVHKTEGKEKTYYVKKGLFYSHKRFQIPTVPAEIYAIKSLEETKRYMPIPLIHRSKAMRLAFWEQTFTFDVFAAHHKCMAKHVDLRAMMTTKLEHLRKRKQQLWAEECDAMSWSIIEETAKDRLHAAFEEMHGWETIDDFVVDKTMLEDVDVGI